MTTTMRTVGLAMALLATACGTTKPQLTPEQEQAEWMAYATPGEHHDHGESLGTFTTRTSFWMDPDAPPEVSTGTATREPMFDGLFVVEHYYGDFMGMPFEGMGITGYDNELEQHQSFWVDSMGSGMFKSTGTCDARCEVIEWEGEMVDPLTGEVETTHMKSYPRSSGEHVFEMWGSDDAGSDYKMMEIVYRRA